jgi:hypothetical protein
MLYSVELRVQAQIRIANVKNKFTRQKTVFAPPNKKPIFGPYLKSYPNVMFRKLVFVLLTVGMLAANAQSNDPKEKVRKGRPDIPGTFLVDLGLNFPSKDTVGFSTGFWGSRSLNVSYQLDKRVGQTKFSVHPGLGLGLERYKFTNFYTPVYINGDLKMIHAATGQGPDFAVKKSQLITNYFDALFEVRFTTNPNDPARSFKTSLGVKAGALLNAATKLKYTQEDETRKIKDKQNWNVNQFRYGVILRVGAGNFNVFGYYSLTPIFKDGKGPDQAEITNFMAGISLAGF